MIGFQILFLALFVPSVIPFRVAQRRSETGSYLGLFRKALAEKAHPSDEKSIKAPFIINTPIPLGIPLSCPENSTTPSNSSQSFIAGSELYTFVTLCGYSLIGQEAYYTSLDDPEECIPACAQTDSDVEGPLCKGIVWDGRNCAFYPNASYDALVLSPGSAASILTLVYAQTNDTTFSNDTDISNDPDALESALAPVVSNSNFNFSAPSNATVGPHTVVFSSCTTSYSSFSNGAIGWHRECTTNWTWTQIIVETGIVVYQTSVEQLLTAAQTPGLGNIGVTSGFSGGFPSAAPAASFTNPEAAITAAGTERSGTAVVTGTSQPKSSEIDGIQVITKVVTITETINGQQLLTVVTITEAGGGAAQTGGDGIIIPTARSSITPAQPAQSQEVQIITEVITVIETAGGSTDVTVVQTTVHSGGENSAATGGIILPSGPPLFSSVVQSAAVISSPPTASLPRVVYLTTTITITRVIDGQTVVTAFVTTLSSEGSAATETGGLIVPAISNKAASSSSSPVSFILPPPLSFIAPPSTLSATLSASASIKGGGVQIITKFITITEVINGQTIVTAFATTLTGGGNQGTETGGVLAPSAISTLASIPGPASSMSVHMGPGPVVQPTPPLASSVAVTSTLTLGEETGAGTGAIISPIVTAAESQLSLSSIPTTLAIPFPPPPITEQTITVTTAINGQIMTYVTILIETLAANTGMQTNGIIQPSAPPSLAPPSSLAPSPVSSSSSASVTLSTSSGSRSSSLLSQPSSPVEPILVTASSSPPPSSLGEVATSSSPSLRSSQVTSGSPFQSIAEQPSTVLINAQATSKQFAVFSSIGGGPQEVSQTGVFAFPTTPSPSVGISSSAVSSQVNSSSFTILVTSLVTSFISSTISIASSASPLLSSVPASPSQSLFADGQQSTVLVPSRISSQSSAFGPQARPSTSYLTSSTRNSVSVLHAISTVLPTPLIPIPSSVMSAAPTVSLSSACDLTVTETVQISLTETIYMSMSSFCNCHNCPVSLSLSAPVSMGSPVSSGLSQIVSPQPSVIPANATTSTTATIAPISSAIFNEQTTGFPPAPPSSSILPLPPISTSSQQAPLASTFNLQPRQDGLTATENLISNACAAAAGGYNVIYNPGFEQTTDSEGYSEPVDYGVTSDDHSKAYIYSVLSPPDGLSHSGNRFLEFSASSGVSATLFQPITLCPGKSYQMGAWVRQVNADFGCQATFMINGEILGTILPGEEWTNDMLGNKTFTAGSSATAVSVDLNVQMVCAGSSTPKVLFLDDLSLIAL